MFVGRLLLPAVHSESYKQVMLQVSEGGVHLPEGYEEV